MNCASTLFTLLLGFSGFQALQSIGKAVASIHTRTLPKQLYPWSENKMATGIIEGILDGLVDASEDTDVALFWRGFKHKWVKKVHRTGKLGNWLRTENKNTFPKDVFINHVAQSGTSSDDAGFSTIYDVVQATHTRFVPGKVVIPISVKERVNFHFKEHVSIQATESNRLRDKTKFTAIINGFNLKIKNGPSRY